MTETTEWTWQSYAQDHARKQSRSDLEAEDTVRRLQGLFLFIDQNSVLKDLLYTATYRKYNGHAYTRDGWATAAGLSAAAPWHLDHLRRIQDHATLGAWYALIGYLSEHPQVGNAFIEGWYSMHAHTQWLEQKDLHLAEKEK